MRSFSPLELLGFTGSVFSVMRSVCGKNVLRGLIIFIPCRYRCAYLNEARSYFSPISDDCESRDDNNQRMMLRLLQQKWIFAYYAVI